MNRALILALVCLSGVASAQPVTIAWRPPTGCTSGQAIVWNGTAWGCGTVGVTDGDKGDVTVSSSGSVWTIDNGTVTLAKQANVATSTILGRVTAGTGSPEALTGTQATTLLDAFTSGLKGLAPASGGGTTNYLRADGTWASPPGAGDITDVVAGVALTGGGTSGSVTLDLAFSSDFQNSADTLDLSTAVTAPGTLDVAGNFSVATNKFTVAASSGNTAVAGTLTGAGKAAIGRASVGAGALSVQSTDAGTALAGTTWDDKFTTFGPNVGNASGGSSAALGLGYSTTSDEAQITAVAPGSAWKKLHTSAHSYAFGIDGGAGDGTTNGCALSSSSVLNCYGGLQVNGTSVPATASLTTNRVVKASGSTAIADTAFPIDDSAATLTLGDNEAADTTVINGNITLKGGTSELNATYIQVDDGTWWQNTDVGRTTTLKIIDIVPAASFNTTGGALISQALAADNRSTKSAGSNTLTNYGIYANAINGDQNIALFVENGSTVFANGPVTMSGTGLSVTGYDTSTSRQISSTYIASSLAGGPTSVLGSVSGTINATAAPRTVKGIDGTVTSTRGSGANAVTNIGVYGNASGAQTNWAGYFQGDLGVTGSATLASQVFMSASTSAFQASGDGLFQRHIRTTSGSSVTISSCGSSPACTGSCTDMAGLFTTGSGATACTLTFAASCTQPTCIVTAENGANQASTTYGVSSTALTLSAAVASASYHYHCFCH